MPNPADWPPKFIETTMVLLEDALPGDALAVVLLRPRRREHCFVVIPIDKVYDILLMRAHGVQTSYRFHHPADLGPVEFTLRPEGRLEILSEMRGAEVGTHVPLAEHTSGEELQTTDLLRRARRVPVTEFPGFGRARVLSAVQREPDL